MNQSDIVIKEGDKGGAVLVFSKNYYRVMISEHLNNQNTYQKIGWKFGPYYYEKKKQKKKLLNKHKNIYTDKELKYLNETDYNTSNFYGLFKIPKFRLITNANAIEEKKFWGC